LIPYFGCTLLYNSFSLQVNIVILSYLTNVLIDALGEDANEGCLTQLFIELFTQSDGLFGFCQSFPMVRMFIAPPNVRMRPVWYSKLRPTIIRVLHQFLRSRPPNLQILDDFAGDIDRDGIHYSILSGINFVKSLVDQSTELVKVAPPDPSARYQLLTDLLCDFRHAEYVANMFHLVIY